MSEHRCGRGGQGQGTSSVRDENQPREWTPRGRNKRSIRLSLLMAASFSVLFSAPAAGQNYPQPPAVSVDTTMPVQTGSVIWVPAGGDLQAALNAARLGDTIELQAGATWTGSFGLPTKTSGTGWIVVRSSAWAQLPPPGTRVGPADAVNM